MQIISCQTHVYSDNYSSTSDPTRNLSDVVCSYSLRFSYMSKARIASQPWQLAAKWPCVSLGGDRGAREVRRRHYLIYPSSVRLEDSARSVKESAIVSQLDDPESLESAS
jgi:hypothetical protein